MCRHTTDAGGEDALAGCWAALPVHLQRQVLQALAPAELLALVLVSKEVGRLALALTHEVALNLCTRPGAASSNAAVAMMIERSSGVASFSSSVASSGGRGGSSSFISKATTACGAGGPRARGAAAWLRRHGHRLDKLVVAAETHGDVAAVLAALNGAAAKTSGRRRPSFVTSLQKQLGLLPAGSEATKPAGGLRLTHFELWVPHKLQKAVMTSLAQFMAGGTLALKVLVVKPLEANTPDSLLRA